MEQKSADLWTQSQVAPILGPKQPNTISSLA